MAPFLNEYFTLLGVVKSSVDGGWEEVRMG